MRSFSTVTAAAVAFSTLASAAITTPVTTKGNAFFVGNDRVCFHFTCLVSLGYLFTNQLGGITVLHPWC